MKAKDTLKKDLEKLIAFFLKDERTKAQKYLHAHTERIQKLQAQLQADGFSLPYSILLDWMLFDPKAYASGYPEPTPDEEDIGELQAWISGACPQKYSFQNEAGERAWMQKVIASFLQNWESWETIQSIYRKEEICSKEDLPPLFQKYGGDPFLFYDFRKALSQRESGTISKEEKNSWKKMLEDFLSSNALALE